ncbi:MAG: hypothetical protein K2Q09_08885 [Phycisphaerales bacterium]|nr:hypothetical protein [Phycisphaerales bacterium]
MAPPPGTAPARHLGIVAASPEGCSLFYREFFRRLEARAGGLPAPRVSLHNEPLGAYLGAVDRADWQTVGQLLAESAKKLVSIGADLLVVPENLLQFGVHLAEHAAPVP